MSRSGQPKSVSFGELELAPGSHVCALYPSATDRDGILRPYLREGLRHGDKCICVMEPADAEPLVVSLREDTQRAALVKERQLDIHESPELYRGNGPTVESVLHFWENSVSEELFEEYTFAREAADMTWALRRALGARELMTLEAELNRFVPRYPQVLLCLYELARFEGNLLVDVLKVHPKILLGEILIDNPYYIEPEEFFATR